MTHVHDLENARATLPCANCGTPLRGEYCHHCGQHRRGSQRLNLGEVLRRFLEHMFDMESGFFHTFVGLLRRPGTVCREYVEGRRKQYINPFGYFVLTGTTSLILTTVISATAGDPLPSNPKDLNADHALWLLLGLLAPLATIWWRLFRKSGFNLAESYVFALYVLAQFLWLEAFLLLPLSFLVAEPEIWVFYLLVWTSYVIFAASGFYRGPFFLTAFKMISSFALLCALLLVISFLGGIFFAITTGSTAP